LTKNPQHDLGKGDELPKQRMMISSEPRLAFDGYSSSAI